MTPDDYVHHGVTPYSNMAPVEDVLIVDHAETQKFENVSIFQVTSTSQTLA